MREWNNERRPGFIPGSNLTVVQARRLRVSDLMARLGDPFENDTNGDEHGE